MRFVVVVALALVVVAGCSNDPTCTSTFTRSYQQGCALMIPCIAGTEVPLGNTISLCETAQMNQFCEMQTAAWIACSSLPDGGGHPHNEICCQAQYIALLECLHPDAGPVLIDPPSTCAP